MTAEENYRLLQEIQANRDFILQAYRQNPELLRHAEPRVRLLLELSEITLPDNKQQTGGIRS